MTLATLPPQQQARPHAATAAADEHTLHGSVDTVTFSNAETGYAIIKIRVDQQFLTYPCVSKKGIATAVGPLAGISPGSRVQVFAGVVISRTGGGVRESFTVRKVSFGTGVERTFPLHSPIIEKIEVERHGDVRRAKLYYLRGLRGKAAKIKEKRDI